MYWGKRGTLQYEETRRSYMRQHTKTVAYKERRRTWLRTTAGRAYRLRAALLRVKRNKEWIDIYKTQHGCEFCGFNTWPECLDFDHKNPKQKIFSVSQKLTYSKKTLQIEIEKCRVLCANCHRHHSKNTHWRRHA